MLDPDYGDITDIHEGHDIKVTVSKQAGKMYATTDVMPRPKSTDLGTKKQIKEWTENIPELDDVFQLKSYEQLENIINAWLNGDDVDDKEDDVVETSTVKTNTSKTSKSKEAESFDKIDDAFADLGGDLPF